MLVASPYTPFNHAHIWQAAKLASVASNARLFARSHSTPLHRIVYPMLRRLLAQPHAAAALLQSACAAAGPSARPFSLVQLAALSASVSVQGRGSRTLWVFSRGCAGSLQGWGRQAAAARGERSSKQCCCSQVSRACGCPRRAVSQPCSHAAIAAACLAITPVLRSPACAGGGSERQAAWCCCVRAATRGRARGPRMGARVL